MKKLISFFTLSIFSVFCFSESFDTICGFSLGSSLEDFKQTETYQFVQTVDSNSYWNERNCICYNYEPYVLKTDKKGKEKGFESINNKKRELIQNNPVKYANKAVYSIDLVFYDNKLFYITIYFNGYKTWADKKGKLSTSYCEYSFKTNEWSPLKDALLEKYDLEVIQTIENPIPINDNWTVPAAARDLFLIYNVDYVLAKCNKTRALNLAVSSNSKSSSYIPEDLVIHYDQLESKDKSRIIELTTWSFDGECNQPFLSLFDQNVLNEIEDTNNKEKYESLKDQI